MSYVICSNVETEDVVQIGGHSDPATFLNNFRSPLILDPDTEVAVESVKIDRSDQWDIKDSDVFFFYFGPEQSAALTSGQVPKNGVRIDVKRGSYTVKGMAAALQLAINTAPIGPDIFGTVEVTTLADAGKFAGFEFKVTPRTKGADRSASFTISDFELNNYLTIGINGSAVAGGEAGTFAYDAGNKEIKCLTSIADDELFAGSSELKVRSSASVRIKDYPLSNGGGLCKFSLNSTDQTSGPFQIGLVRPTHPYVNNGYPDTVNYGTGQQGKGPAGRGTTYMDYFAVFDGTELKLYHWAYDTGNDNWNQKEIKYYEAPGASVGTVITKTSINDGTFETLVFELQGNELEVKVLDNKGASSTLIGAAITAIKPYAYPPLGNAQDTLFPAVALTKEDQTLKFVEYEAKEIAGWVYSTPSNTNVFGITAGGANKRAYQPRGTATLVPGSDWYSNAVQSQNANNELRYNQLRPSLLWKSTGTETFVYTRPNASGVIDYVPVLVTGEEPRDATKDDFDQVLYVIPLPENQANMSKELGFGKWNVVEYSVFKGAGDLLGFRTLKSIEAGTYTVHSAFIRINDLPIQSFNGATSSRSNILYHIPRFSNDGRQFGELFFAAPDRTYIKLNNTDRITLNQLKIDIVGRNERIVSDLTGASIVCLHFRKAVK